MLLYAPHILFVRRADPVEKDGLGRSVKPAEERWECVGECRCDDSNISEVTSANGEVFRPSYHIVCAGGCDVRMGDFVRVVKAVTYEQRAEGVVRNITGCNYLDYKNVYV